MDGKRRIILVSILLLSFRILFSQTTVTKSWSGSLVLDESTGNPTAVTYVSGVDFAASIVIESITVSVTFSKVDNTCASPGAGDPFNDEIRFIVRGPAALPTSNRRVINFGDFTGTTATGSVTMSFPGGSALPANPTTGTYASDQSLSVYEQESPFGDWFIRGRDNLADDELCYTGYSISITGNWPLPVSMTNLGLSRLQNKNIIVAWKTASELNNDKYVVERSENGEDWEPIGTIKGAGTTNDQKEYKFEDINSLVAESYYRLIQIDFDGTKTISKVLYAEPLTEEVSSGATARIKVLTNPCVGKQCVLDISHANTLKSLNVFSINGAFQMNENVLFETKSENHTMDLSKLNSGVYLLIGESYTGGRSFAKIVIP